MTSAADRFEWGNCASWCLTRHADWDIEPEGHDGPRWPTIHPDDGRLISPQCRMMTAMWSSG